ncbi:NAD(P)-dependent oxidoreductase [Occultella gossypii]|uniref:NAD(P)-dependent oxidoreductase n=1 Tax=Occultella gossypii TaxID=2800820 RepID=A0ABS7SH28_9MICO|nr:NAD(P)-dependent oxidoreductase [Occultella gossypii]MBZ2199638.1 NAD(P)-dependent oxidoreductase [Occultella gossypii]
MTSGTSGTGSAGSAQAHGGAVSRAAGTRVGVIGLGVMGAPMARHMATAGIPTTVWARRPAITDALAAHGASVAASAAELAAASDVVVLVLPGMPEIDAVLAGPDGLLAGGANLPDGVARAGEVGSPEEGPDGVARVAEVGSPEDSAASQSSRLLVICSTVSPRDVRELADRPELRDAGWRVVDAPISGGEQGAEAGTLAIFVGGEREDVEVVARVLGATGNPVHLGPLGSGQVGKACNQVIVAATVTALGEAAVLAERSGLDVAALFDLLGGGYAGSRLLEVKKDRFVAHDHSPSGAAKYMVKDLTGALDQAEDARTTLPLTRQLLQTFTDLTAAGLGDNDTAVVQAWIERQGEQSS